jgi:hypothetical protein
MEYYSFVMYNGATSCAGIQIKKRRGFGEEPTPPEYRTDGGVGWLAGARCS